ncbi:MAG: ferrous iron transport protein A [Candidatus Aminicenantes bacterium]|nr:ferrous iron transport protein A [Candidatus Aminicenantes bacterium]
MTNLIGSPKHKKLKIINISGGTEVRRRLFSLGIHKGDIVQLDTRSMFRGPVLIKNLSTDTSVAIGRGIASKITVDILE